MCCGESFFSTLSCSLQMSNYKIPNYCVYPQKDRFLQFLNKSYEHALCFMKYENTIVQLHLFFLVCIIQKENT
jgi:hypothetical protein